MGNRSAKRAKQAQLMSSIQSQTKLFEEVHLVSRLFPPTNVEEKPQRKWSPNVAEAVDAKAVAALEKGGQGEGGEMGGLGQLPPELLKALLVWLDVESLFVLSQTCAWAYGLVHHQHSDLVVLRLMKHVHFDEPPTVQKEDDEAPAAEQVDTLLHRPEERGVWLKIRDGLMHGLRKDKGLRQAFEAAWDPREPDCRLAIVLSLRQFKVDPALYYLCRQASVRSTGAEESRSNGLSEAVAGGLRAQRVKLFRDQTWAEEEEEDAWFQRQEITFSSQIVPVTTVDQFDSIIRAHENLMMEWGEKKSLHLYVPPAGEALQWLGRMVQSREVALWHDTQFQGGGHSGCRFVVLGAQGHACVAQWEYYSNYCGGPYSSYDCGMG